MMMVQHLVAANAPHTFVAQSINATTTTTATSPIPTPTPPPTSTPISTSTSTSTSTPTPTNIISSLQQSTISPASPAARIDSMSQSETRAIDLQDTIPKSPTTTPTTTNCNTSIITSPTVSTSPLSFTSNVTSPVSTNCSPTRSTISPSRPSVLHDELIDCREEFAVLYNHLRQRKYISSSNNSTNNTNNNNNNKEDNENNNNIHNSNKTPTRVLEEQLLSPGNVPLNLNLSPKSDTTTPMSRIMLEQQIRRTVITSNSNSSISSSSQESVQLPSSPSSLTESCSETLTTKSKSISTTKHRHHHNPHSQLFCDGDGGGIDGDNVEEDNNSLDVTMDTPTSTPTTICDIIKVEEGDKSTNVTTFASDEEEDDEEYPLDLSINATISRSRTRSYSGTESDDSGSGVADGDILLHTAKLLKSDERSSAYKKSLMKRYCKCFNIFLIFVVGFFFYIFLFFWIDN